MVHLKNGSILKLRQVTPINTDLHKKYILARRIALISSAYLTLASIIIIAISLNANTDIYNLCAPRIISTFIAAVCIAVVSAFYAFYFNYKNSHTS